MPTALRVNVSQNDIDRSTPRTINHCAVHVAIKRKFPDSTHVKVTREQIKFCRQAKRLRYVLTMPARAANLIEKYDRKGKKAIKPFHIDFHDVYTAPMERYRRNKPGSGPKPKSGKKCKRPLWDPSARWAGGRVARVF
jgi:hypothetical protein